MRELLKGNLNKRMELSGVFDKYGVRKSYLRGKSKPDRIPTVLLKDIKDAEGNEIANHMWIQEAMLFKHLKPIKGDTFYFSAKIGTYIKGYKGERVKEEKRIAIDYRLKHFKNIRIRRNEENAKTVLMKARKKKRNKAFAKQRKRKLYGMNLLGS